MRRRFFILCSVLVLIPALGFGQGNWHTMDPGTNTSLFDVHFVSVSEGWIAGNVGTILHTVDGGATWEEQVAPPVNQYFCIFFADESHGWAGGVGGKMIRTTDGGQTWLDGSAGTGYRFDICFVGTDSGWAVGGDFGGFPSYIPDREIFFTPDGGATWVSQYGRAYEDPLRAVYFIDNNNGYAVGEYGAVMHTTNGGGLWVEESTFSSYHLYDVVFDDLNTGWIVGYYLGLPHAASIFKTTDGGATWNEQTFGVDESYGSLAFGDALNGWAVGGRILHTTDGGETWEYQTSPTDEALDKVFAVDHNTAWAVGLNGALATTTAIQCSDVQSLKARCQADSVLQAKAIFSSSVYNGETVMFTIDGTDDYEATVINRRATLSLPGYPRGEHIVALTDPAGCLDPLTTRCRNRFIAENQGSEDFDDMNPVEQVGESARTELLGAYPNPFNPTTTIRYVLGIDADVSVRVYNMLGQEVATLVNEAQRAGEQSAVWHGTNNFGQSVSSGLYMYILRAGSVVETGRLMLLK